MQRSANALLNCFPMQGSGDATAAYFDWSSFDLDCQSEAPQAAAKVAACPGNAAPLWRCNLSDASSTFEVEMLCRGVGDGPVRNSYDGEECALQVPAPLFTLPTSGATQTLRPAWQDALATRKSVPSGGAWCPFATCHEPSNALVTTGVTTGSMGASRPALKTGFADWDFGMSTTTAAQMVPRISATNPQSYTPFDVTQMVPGQSPGVTLASMFPTFADPSDESRSGASAFQVQPVTVGKPVSAFVTSTVAQGAAGAPAGAQTQGSATPEDALRRRVQLQVLKLMHTETDHSQLGWLQELSDMATTAPMSLLSTLNQQLDVLLQPLPGPYNPRPAGMPPSAACQQQGLASVTPAPSAGAPPSQNCAHVHNAGLAPTGTGAKPENPFLWSLQGQGQAQSMGNGGVSGVAAVGMQPSAVNNGVQVTSGLRRLSSGAFQCVPCQPTASEVEVSQFFMAGATVPQVAHTVTGTMAALSGMPGNSAGGQHCAGAWFNKQSTSQTPFSSVVPSSVPNCSLAAQNVNVNRGFGPAFHEVSMVPSWISHPSLQQQQQQRRPSSGTSVGVASVTTGGGFLNRAASHHQHHAGSVVKHEELSVSHGAGVMKVEPARSRLGSMGTEQRWWRKQNSFTMAIDDIVNKMRSGEALVDRRATSRPHLIREESVLIGDGDGALISVERVRQMYAKPIKDAAKLLSVSVMSLKRTCRKMGVRRWPFRKLASLSELEVTVKEDQLEQQLQPSDKEAVMQFIEVEKARIMSDPDRDVDPMLHNLRKAKIHMKYEKWGRKALNRVGHSHGTASAAASRPGSLFDAGDDDGADDDEM